MKPAHIPIFVKIAGLYNLALSLGLFVPVMQRLMGLNVTDQALAKVIGVLLVYTAVVQYFASFDVKKYAWIIFWEGLLRCLRLLFLFTTDSGAIWASWPPYLESLISRLAVFIFL